MSDPVSAISSAINVSELPQNNIAEKFVDALNNFSATGPSSLATTNDLIKYQVSLFDITNVMKVLSSIGASIATLLRG